MRPKLVFSGPSLAPADRAPGDGLVFLPPAAQGDIVAAVRRYDPAAILLIDGLFQSAPAVRHKELLWAMARRVAAIGAASMGALRAAELHPHMQGVGLIYRWYRRHALAPDDAVAVLHGPAELDFAPLGAALVDLRMAFRTARRRGIVTADAALRLEGAAARLNFRDRSLDAAIAAALPEATADLRAALAAAHPGQKRRDALAALAILRDDRFLPSPAPTVFEITRAFELDLYDAGLTREEISADSGIAQRGLDV